MGWAEKYIQKLADGEEVSFRPKGNSMVPKINSGDLVTVSPDVLDEDNPPAKDDIVLCKVKGREYVHLVKAIKGEGDKRRFLIGNNKGGTNGWIGLSAIYGKVINVEP